MNKLTPKQEKFCNLYIELGNAAEAYRQSYDCSKTKDNVIYVKASELLANGSIMVRVAELQESVKETHSITRDYIVKGLLEIISDADYTFNLGKDSKLTKDDSKAFYRIMQQTKNTDKLRALETLAKMLGLNEPEKHEHKIEQIEIIEKKR
jgi:hypothetical protein